MNTSEIAASVETHPWKWFIPPMANKLIIGTFPPHCSKRKFEFFYPNPSNKFWKILARIASKDLLFHPITEHEKEQAVIQRKLLLEQLNLGITDMGARVLRRENRSTDEHLQPLEFMDLVGLLAQYPHIHTLIFTSSAAKNSAWSWFIRYCEQNGINLDLQLHKSSFPKFGKMEVDGKNYDLIIVRSPSGAAAQPFDELVRQYQLALCNE